MSIRYTLTLSSRHEAFVSIEGSPFGLRAGGLLFDSDADVVAFTPSELYIGYCRACIVGAVGMALTDELPDLADDMEDTINRLGLECECG